MKESYEINKGTGLIEVTDNKKSGFIEASEPDLRKILNSLKQETIIADRLFSRANFLANGLKTLSSKRCTKTEIEKVPSCLIDEFFIEIDKLHTINDGLVSTIKYMEQTIGSNYIGSLEEQSTD